MNKRIYVIASAVLLAIMVTPFALAAGEGGPITGGQRNPDNDASHALTRETQVIADTSTYGTRQSNKSNSGGGAIYGCRSGAGGSPKDNEPCIRSNNLAKGLAFEFETKGDQAGTINALGGDAARPFTTNATGVATGLNADRVDSMSADQIIQSAVSQATGKPASTTPATGTTPALPPFAQVTTEGNLGARRGVVTSNRQGPGSYRVIFEGDITKCAIEGTVISTNSSSISVQPSLDGGNRSTTVEVHTYSLVTASGGAVSVVPADYTTHLAVTC